jgi:RHS repeat-associated protein
MRSACCPAFIAALIFFAMFTTATSLAAPVISSVSANANTTGTPVTITGSGFGATQGTSTVKFFGVTATQISSWSATSIVAVLPSVANGQATVVVTVGGVASNTMIFAVMNPLTYSLMPSSGVVGTAVTIWGSNFGSTQGTSTATFNGISAQISSWGNFSIVAVAPAGVPNGNINVKVTVGGLASNTQTFAVSANPSISMVAMNLGSYSISANSAPVDQDVDVIGVNFGASQGASTITFNGVPAVASFWSATSITAAVPSGATTGNVVVTVNGVASNGVAFMVSPLSQLSGVGFVQGNYSAVSTAEYDTSNNVAACHQDSSGAMTSTIQVPFPLEQTAGDLNVVIVSWRDTNADTQVLGDDGNNQYYAMGKFSQSGNGQQQIWFAPNIVGGTNIVDVVFASTKGNCVTAPEVRIAEYRGISTNSGLSAVDVSATQNTSSSATCNSGSKSTTNQNDLLVGANLAGKTTTLAGANYVNHVVTTPQGDALEDQIVTSTGSYSAGATMAASGNCLMQMVAFKEAPNQAPVVDPGPNQTITWPANAVTLNGTVTDDGLPNNTLTISWSKLSGPGTVTFGSPSAASTQATFSTYGTYVLQLTANDSQLSSSANVTVTVNTPAISIVLSPAIAGPDVPGSTQTMTAAVTVSGTGAPVSGASVQFTVTGANANTGSASTNSSGIANFTYQGTSNGTDTVLATYSGQNSNTATVSWITPIQPVSTGTVLGRFFLPATNCGSWCNSMTLTPTSTPVFTQAFPNIDFDPVIGTIPGNTSGVDDNTRPFTEITTDLNGNFTGTIVAQGNGYQAGVGALFQFQAEFSGTFIASHAGNVTVSFFTDDGLLFGVGGGATYVSGPLVNPPASHTTVFQAFPLMMSYNNNTNPPLATTVVFNVPAPGTYPYELDYFECCSGTLALNMTIGQTTTSGLPPIGQLTITPTTPASIQVGQTETLTVRAVDGSGAPVANLGVGLQINGANTQVLSSTTNSSGLATFSYTGVNGGTDFVQAIANITGMGTYSNSVKVPWTIPAGTNGCSVFIFTPQGWIASPAIGATVQGQVPITLASGITLTSGTLKMFPSSNPNQITILSPNTSGTGPLTLGTIDASLLANGEYTIQLEATTSGGSCQLNEIVVSVTGQYKPGRKTVTVTDFKVPLAGIPINVTRTYDSLNRGVVGDFGNGWNLSTNVQLSVDQLMDVSFTWDGKRQTFYFTPQSAGQVLFPWLILPHYTPQPGLYGTLTSNGCSALIQVNGALVQDTLGVACFPGGSYQPTVYTYTDPSGRVYTISSTGQLQSIKDLNGNTLTFTPNGITSSVNGTVIPFLRDNQGRITQITDLNGNNYQYTYDLGGTCPAGPVCAVTFTGNSTTVGTYTYSGDHLLAQFTDPGGNASLSTYDSNGRLQTFTDGNHNEWQYSYNVATNTTTTINPDQGTVTRTDDSFGNPLSITEQVNSTTTRATTYQYDAKENLISMTDACGNGTCSDTVGTNHTWHYTYDSNGFQTSVQDPLGNTSHKTYNPYGGVLTATDAANTNTQTTTYDANFNPQQTVDLLNGTNTFVSSATYDALGNQLTYTDSNGKPTTFAYDPSGHLAQVTDALNEITHNYYDPMGRIQLTVDPMGNKTQFTYDALGNLKTKTDASNKITQYVYDNNGNKLSETDANTNITHFDYDNANHLKKITYPDTTTKQYTYDFRGNKLTETDQSGRVTKYVYDYAGELTNVTYAYGTTDAGTVNYTYDLDGRQASVQDELGNVTTNKYDVAGRLITVADALTHSTNYGYDADNRKASVQNANLNTTTYNYDARGRVSKITYPIVPPAPQPTTTQYTYDGMGHVLTITDQAGKVTTKTYDDVGRLSTVKDAILPTGNVTQYFYDLNGNLRFLEDGLYRVTSYQYDPLNRRASRTLPLNQVEYYTYDAVGNLQTRQDFNGYTTTYNYDTLNRLLSKVPDSRLSQATVSFTYTPTGHRLSMMDASGTTNYSSYDNRDRLKTKVTPEGTLNYTYDAHGNLKSIVSSNTNGASLAYNYDALNRLFQACDNRISPNCGAAGVTNYSYDAVSNLSSYTYPNTIQTANLFDTQNRLTQTCSATSSPACSASQKLASYAYTLGNAGNRTNVAELNGRSVTYGYDNDYRLTSEAITGDPAGHNGTVSYTQYDAVGNRLQMASTLNAVPGGSFSYDANDRLLTDLYDANGNTTSSAGIVNTYDFENRMLAHGALSLVYDGDGKRVSETVGSATTKYLVDELNPTGYTQVMDELVNGSVTRTYAYGLNRISENQLINGTWTPSFYGYDGHGNTRFLANSAGTITDTYTFDAFGAPIASTGTTPNSYLYSGERFDNSLNLYHLRARYYNMLTGRFETMDQYAGSIFDPATLHKYIYARSNPVNRIDPRGRADAVEMPALIWRIVSAATIGLFVGTEIRELYCEAASAVASGPGPEPDFPVVQRPPQPSVGPAPEICGPQSHDEWPGNPTENYPLEQVQNPPGTEAP